MWFQILHNLISNGNIARSSLYFLSIRMIHGSPAPYLLDIIMRRMAEGIERASFANEVSEALPVNSGLSFRRAFSIVPASTRRLACARKYHDWWARNSSPVSSILTLLSSSLSPSIYLSVLLLFIHFALRPIWYEVYKEHTMEPDFTRPHFRLWSLNTSFASAIVRPFDTILRLLIEKDILSLLNERRVKSQEEVH